MPDLEQSPDSFGSISPDSNETRIEELMRQTKESLRFADLEYRMLSNTQGVSDAHKRNINPSYHTNHVLNYCYPSKDS